MRINFTQIFGWLAFYLFVMSFFWKSADTSAAGISTGHTFTNGEQVTAAKVNDAINNATLTNIATGDYGNLSITLGKMGANSVNSSKVVDLSLTGGPSGDLASNTVTTVNIATNTFTGVEFSTSVLWPANGTVSFTNAGVTLAFRNDQIAAAAVVGTNYSGGAPSSGIVPRLNASGKLDPSLYYKATNNYDYIDGDVGALASFVDLASVTTIATNGQVVIFAKATYKRTSADAGPFSIRVKDNSGAVIFQTTRDDIGGDPVIVQVMDFGPDTLSGSAKTYTLSGAVGAGSIGNWCLNSTLDTFGATNATCIVVQEHPIP